MFFQLGSEETLVPPNFRTIQAEGVRVTSIFLTGMGGSEPYPGAAAVPPSH
jgi:hypothetical protein